MDASTRVIWLSVAFARTVSALATDSRAASAMAVEVDEGATGVDMLGLRSLSLGQVRKGECL